MIECNIFNDKIEQNYVLFSDTVSFMLQWYSEMFENNKATKTDLQGVITCETNNKEIIWEKRPMMLSQVHQYSKKFRNGEITDKDFLVILCEYGDRKNNLDWNSNLYKK